MEILEKEVLNQKLYTYYKEKFGEKESDFFYEQPAANVFVFKRENKVITLKCHILKGTIEAFEEILNKK